MIVETDDLIRELIVRWLTEAGCAVAAGDAQPGTVALVIVDVPNPADPGAALRALDLRHGAPVLAVSGRFRRDFVASKGAARRLGVAGTLAKPFTREELLAAIDQCLGGP